MEAHIRIVAHLSWPNAAVYWLTFLRIWEVLGSNLIKSILSEVFVIFVVPPDSFYKKEP
jgi:hypothetical protein